MTDPQFTEAKDLNSNVYAVSRVINFTRKIFVRLAVKRREWYLTFLFSILGQIILLTFFQKSEKCISKTDVLRIKLTFLFDLKWSSTWRHISGNTFSLRTKQTISNSHQYQLSKCSMIRVGRRKKPFVLINRRVLLYESKTTIQRELANTFLKFE